MSSGLIKQHYAYTHGTVTEGGGGRTNAIISMLHDAKCAQRIFKHSTMFSRLKMGCAFLWYLSKHKNETIFIHYAIFASLFTQKITTNQFFLKALFVLLKNIDSRNTLIVEVNDLPFEQAIDLELPRNHMDRFDSMIFDLKLAKYIFASELMAEYVAIKFHLDPRRCSVLLNGGPPPPARVKTDSDSKIIKFVYAGTLNRGRQIEAMLRVFAGSEHLLFLLGVGGGWIESEFSLFNNIKYIGALEEKEAHSFVATCDMGVIPYDDSRFYYNICYPTKASFYITAGLPILTTNLNELRRHFDSQSAIFLNLDKWHLFLAEPDAFYRIKNMKHQVEKISIKFQWQNLWNEWLKNLEGAMSM